MDARTRQRMHEIYNRNCDRVYRICFLYLKNEQDVYDAAQETFFRLMQKNPEFSDEEHERAWLVRVAVNVCKDALKSWWKRNRSGQEALEEQKLADARPVETDDSPVLAAVLALPEKYRAPVYLHYYEGYTVAEIAEILHKNPSTLRGRMGKAKELLRKELEYVSPNQK